MRNSFHAISRAKPTGRRFDGHSRCQGVTHASHQAHSYPAGKDGRKTIWKKDGFARKVADTAQDLTPARFDVPAGDGVGGTKLTGAALHAFLRG